VGPKVNWAYWLNDGLFNQNQEHQKTDFAAVDCDLNKNIIFYDFKNINFGQEFVYEWTDESVAKAFSEKLAQIRKRCPDVRVVIDPQLDWNQELADQIVQKKVSVSQLANSITDFNTKYYIDGIGMVQQFKITFLYHYNNYSYFFLNSPYFFDKSCIERQTHIRVFKGVEAIIHSEKSSTYFILWLPGRTRPCETSRF
jgi:hypothetical protein